MTKRRDVAAELKAELTDPDVVLGALGLLEGAKRQRDGYVIRCPWHAERTPSCSVQRRDNVLLAHCFGCGEGGDVLELVGAVYGLDPGTRFADVLLEAAHLASRPDLITELGGHAAPASPRPTPKPRPAPARPPEPPALEAEAFAAIADALLELAPLRGQADVRAYLADRRLEVDAEANGWGALPAPEHQAPLLAALEERVGPDVLDRSQLIMRRNGRARLVWTEHRLIIPWRTTAGTVETLQRRLLRQQGEREHKYVFPSGRRPTHPYGVDAMRWIRPDDELAIVEGAVDVLALRRLVQRRRLRCAVLGLPGLEGWRTDWAELGRGRVVRVALDADDAGDRKHNIADELWHAGALDVRRTRPRRGKDWADELMLEEGTR